MILLGAYPVDIFAGTARVVLYTVVPAAFVATVPARLIADIDAVRAAWLATAAATFAFAGWGAFALGLRRYTSGSAWIRS